MNNPSPELPFTLGDKKKPRTNKDLCSVARLKALALYAEIEEMKADIDPLFEPDKDIFDD